MKRRSILKLVVALAAVSVAVGIGASVASAHGFCTDGACPPTTTWNVVPTAEPGNTAQPGNCPAGTAGFVVFTDLAGGPNGSLSQPYNIGMGAFTGNVTITYNPATNHLDFSVVPTNNTPQIGVIQVRMHGGAGQGGENATNIYSYAIPVHSDTALHFTGPSSNILFCLSTVLAVGTNSIKAVRSGKLVTLRWKTSSEANVLGFRVYRKTGAKKVQLTKRIIPAAGAISSKSTHAYSFRARLASAKLAATSRYVLVEIHRDGTRTSYGPMRAVPAT